MKSANDSVIPEFTSKLELMQMSSDFHITKEDVINKVSQAQVMFRGIKTASGDQTANLKSLEGVSHFIVDEMEEFKDKERFDTIDLSVRNPFIPNKTICIMNPSNTSHFSYSEWLQNNHRIEVIDGYEVQVSTHPDVEHIHTTWLDNVDNLPKDYIRKLLRIKEETPEYYGYKIIGQYLDSAEGALLKRINTYKPSDLKPESIATLVGRVGAPRGSVAVYLVPLVSITLGVSFLGEQVHPLAYTGAFLVVLGAWLTSRREVPR
jgi:phage terminase large subunit